MVGQQRGHHLRKIERGGRGGRESTQPPGSSAEDGEQDRDDLSGTEELVGDFGRRGRGCVVGDRGDGPRRRRTKASRAGMASKHGRAAAAGAEGAARHGCCVRRLGLREGERGVVRLVELPRGNGQSITWRWHSSVILYESSFSIFSEPGFSSSATPSNLYAGSSPLLGPIPRSGTVRLESTSGFEDFRSERVPEHALSRSAVP